MDYREAIMAFVPGCEQEAADKRVICEAAGRCGRTILSRECEAMHLTASGLVLDESHTQALMVWHNLFSAWSFPGGHADGEGDLLGVALREAVEETGITRVLPLREGIASLDILPVFGHVRRGRYVPAHLHLSASYLLVAPKGQPLRYKEDENSAVRWFPLGELAAASGEPHMAAVYEKLIGRI
ncbi:NUDIX hydrolase [Provencibacterium massiliense]|uniref:NUDIX hydrolase n=1 Tax=Provencibacterium massiliense TaxID=1841868 RepID=UPI0009A797B1|nr:NUDIX hydrolase [Provencibacterium massiliense]